jgi:hypothetical protein
VTRLLQEIAATTQNAKHYSIKQRQHWEVLEHISFWEAFTVLRNVVARIMA